MSELVEIAILAYRNGRYRDSIELFLQVTDSEPDNWLARLYLGMSYEKTGRVVDAHRLLKRMASECPDDHLRVKAENALPLVEAEMRKRFHKEPITQNNKKPSASSSDRDLLDEFVWVG
jgi:cytochrome c-type biogenesis protein CcmH/NrfG